MRFSLRSFLVLPFVLLLFIAAGTIGWAGFRAGHESIEQFERQMAAEIGVRISSHIDRFFSTAAHAALTNAEAIRSGRLDPNSVDDLQRQFVGQIRHLPYLTFVSFGRADGQYVGATRLLDTNEVRLMTSLKAEGMTIDTFHVDDGNVRSERILRGPPFDARSRIWYRRAETAGNTGWYPVYKYKPYDSLGIGLSVPVRDARGRLLGVTTGDVALAQISRYLRSQPVGRTGVAFVAERDGKLIATSQPAPVFRLDGETVTRFAIAEYDDARVRAAGEWLTQHGVVSGQQFLKIGDERVLLDVRQFRDNHGLDLIVGVLLPERDYAAGFHTSLRFLAWLALGIALAGAGVAIVMSGWLVRPLRELNRRAERIANSEWSGDVGAGSRIREFAELGRSFNKMAEGLHEAFTSLETRVGERTQALEAANAELERLASLDGLTRIGNRRRFDTVLQWEWRRSLRERQPLSLLMLDVDQFKAYNDEYGHQAGDDVLIRIAAVCADACQRPTDMAARYGGEEFAVVLANTDNEGAMRVAASIAEGIRALAIPHRKATAMPQITVSIGVATTLPDPRQKADSLIAQADQALYAAKRQGRNRIVAAP